jgi:hypothetical protein
VLTAALAAAFDLAAASGVVHTAVLVAVRMATLAVDHTAVLAAAMVEDIADVGRTLIANRLPA